MIICQVIGTVVSTTKDEKLVGKKLMLVQSMDLVTGKLDGKPLVAIDTVSAGKDDVVMLVSGSSARQTEITQGTPVDAAIIAIIDLIEMEGKVVFQK